MPKVGEEKDSVDIVIKDEGVGILPEELEFVCNPFFVGSNQISSADTKPLGLGLAVTKHYCDLLGLSLKVESENGKWTKVTVSIPF